MVRIKVKGNFNRSERFLKKAMQKNPYQVLQKYGEIGLEALVSSTPYDTGKTASSWYYEIHEDNGIYTLNWSNSNISDEWCNIAVILDTGHGTSNGGYVQGRNYIRPALQPIFDAIADSAWKEVTDA